MRLINKYKNILIGVLSAILVGCSGGGTCNTGGNPTPGVLSLAIQAPSQYPAGLPVEIIVPITMVNTSDVDAVNLVYSIPNATNHTGVVITPNPTGVIGNDCSNIPAGTSCDMTATVAAFANPGSFTVLATPTPTNLATQAYHKITNDNTIQVTANLGLVDVPNNGEPYYILPTNQTVLRAPSGDTQVFVSVLIRDGNGVTSLAFEDGEGNDITSQLTAVGTITYTDYSVNTYRVNIPDTVSVQQVKVTSNMCPALTSVPECSNTAVINVAAVNTGILSMQPNYFRMTESYTTQVVTLRNIGNINISNLSFPAIAQPFSINNNNCTSITTLEPNASCTFDVVYTPGTTDDEASYQVDYNNGTTTSSVTAVIPYVGTRVAELVANPTSISLSPESSQQIVTITNDGTAIATNLNPTIPAPLSQVSTTCTNQLAVGDSCTYTISYSGASSAGSSDIVINYSGGNLSNVTVTASWVVAVNYAYMPYRGGSNDGKTYRCVVGTSSAESYFDNCTIQERSPFASGTITSAAINGKNYIYGSSVSNGYYRYVFNQYGTVESFVEQNIGTDTSNGSARGIAIANINGQNYAYLTLQSPTRLYVCQIDNNGDFINCQANDAVIDVSGSSTYLAILGLGVRSFQGIDYIYLPNSASPYDVSTFRSNLNSSTGLFESTDITSILDEIEDTNGFKSIAFNTTTSGRTYAYLGSDSSSSQTGIYKCATTESGLFSECEFTSNLTGTELPFITFTTISGVRYAYVVAKGSVETSSGPINTNLVQVCSVNQENGALLDCAPARNTYPDPFDYTQTSPAGVAFGVFEKEPTDCNGNCRIFVSASGHDGNFASIEGSNGNGFKGADLFCQADSNNPVPGSTYWKALLLNNNSTIAGNDYYKLDRTTKIATAANGNLIWGTNQNLDSIIGVGFSGLNVWTGGYGSGYNCNDWTSGSGGVSGSTGDSGAGNNPNWFQYNTPSCDGGFLGDLGVYCVEQYHF